MIITVSRVPQLIDGLRQLPGRLGRYYRPEESGPLEVGPFADADVVLLCEHPSFEQLSSGHPTGNISAR